MIQEKFIYVYGQRKKKKRNEIRNFSERKLKRKKIEGRSTYYILQYHVYVCEYIHIYIFLFVSFNFFSHRIFESRSFSYYFSRRSASRALKTFLLRILNRKYSFNVFKALQRLHRCFHYVNKKQKTKKKDGWHIQEASEKIQNSFFPFYRT